MDTANFEERLKRLEDIKDIEDLHREYVYWASNCEWDNVLDCFTDDAHAVIGVHPPATGKDELSRLFRVNVHNRNEGKGRDSHFATQPVIKVNGDTANGHWLMYILISDMETGNAKRWAAGRHDVEYVRVNGQWKIKDIIWARPWPNL